MTIYIILISIALIGAIFVKSDSHKTIKKAYLFLTFTPIIVTSAIRAASVGSDTAMHTRVFKYLSSGYTVQRVYDMDRFEYGFILFNRLLTYLSEDSQILIVITSIFILTSVAVFIYKNSANVALSTILYITLNEYATHMNVMREGIAIAIFLYAFEFLKKGKIWAYVLLVLIAAQFHTVAYTFLVLILFRYMKFTMRSFFATIALSGAGFIFGKTIFSYFTAIFPQYSDYGTSEFGESNYFAAVLNAMIAAVILLFGIAYIYNNRKKSYTVMTSKELNAKPGKIVTGSVEHTDLIAYCIAFYTIFAFCVIQMTIFNRLQMCFSIFSIIWLPYGHSLIKNTEERSFMSWLIIGCTLAYFIIVAAYRPEWYGIVPYAVSDSFPFFQ